MAVPVTRYAKSGNVHIAYQVFGSGPNDLVFIPGFISHLENYWEHPDLARWLLRLGSFARVIMFDKRGTGLSDPVAAVPSLDLRMDDVRAVMDAARSERAAILGVSEGGALAALFAATYPQRCQQAVLYGAWARFPVPAEVLEPLFKYIDRAWGNGLGGICPIAPDRSSHASLVGPFRAPGREPGRGDGGAADVRRNGRQ
jgi:pimeloyl-ACP methyl ester carboxylesterase